MSVPPKLLKKDTRSSYSTDLSSYEIWQVLNHLMMESISPHCLYGTMLYEMLGSCLTITSNKKRKISALEPEDFYAFCFQSLVMLSMTKKPEQRFEIMLELFDNGLERNIPHDYARKAVIVPVDDPRFDSEKVNRHCGMFLELYDKFRQDVMYRYFNLTETFAKRNHYNKSQTGLFADFEEHLHVFTLSLMRAIDKFVPYSGTLASYIQMWFEHAKGSSAFMAYGDEAFSITRTMRKSVHDGDADIRNKAIPLSDREELIPEVVTEAVFDEEFIAHLAAIPSSSLLFIEFSLPFSPSTYIKEHNLWRAA